MANLADRLKRIQEQKKSGSPSAGKVSGSVSLGISSLTKKGWVEIGFCVLKREIDAGTPLKARKKLPKTLPILISDLAGKDLPLTEDFLFFDLETTGLSGGAGTAAFLAAFGRLASEKNIHITQYLLLDYPGENDFLNAVLKEFTPNSVIVSYNGKCFDSQILKTRCLMNRIKPPVYAHVDLLHPARRLWKKLLPDCSQGTVESGIIGISREDDTPGALAPDIWFEFLKTGKIERLIGICDHNCADIAGLSAALEAVVSIAENPLESDYRYDFERLALYWRDFLRRTRQKDGDLQITGEKLLFHAAQKKYPVASYVYALDLLRGGNFKEGRKRLLEISASIFPERIRAAAFRALAIDSERRLKCLDEAIEFVNRGLELLPQGNTKGEFEKRKERLEKKNGTKVSRLIP